MDASFRKLKGVTFYTTYRKLHQHHSTSSDYSMKRQDVIGNPEMTRIIEDDGWLYEDFVKKYQESWEWDQTPIGG
jgi:hypothetical protein